MAAGSAAALWFPHPFVRAEGVAGGDGGGSGGSGGYGRLRAGDDDRDRVMSLLKTAFTQGRLTGEELDARTGQALAARTYAELDALTEDIPGIPRPDGPASSPVPNPASPARPSPRYAAGGWPGRLPYRLAAWPLRSLPRTPATSSTMPGKVPGPALSMAGLACCSCWPLPPCSRHSSSWDTRWSPHWRRRAPEGRTGPPGAEGVPAACPNGGATTASRGHSRADRPGPRRSQYQQVASRQRHRVPKLTVQLRFPHPLDGGQDATDLSS